MHVFFGAAATRTRARERTGLYGFVREVQRRVPKIQIVIIGGNHDSALRIDLPGALLEEGQVALPSEYGAPYIITRRLIEEGRNNLVLRSPLDLPFPVRFLQGTCDKDVDKSVALQLLDHATGPDMRLTLVKGADHRFSNPECLALIGAVVAEFVAGTGGAKAGLAYMILQSGYNLQIPRMFAALLLITLTGIALFALMVWLSNRALQNWHESALEVEH